MHYSWQTPPRRRYPTIPMEELTHKRNPKPVVLLYEIPEVRYHRGKYNGAKLRELRKLKGVGRPPRDPSHT